MRTAHHYINDMNINTTQVNRVICANAQAASSMATSGYFVVQLDSTICPVWCSLTTPKVSLNSWVFPSGRTSSDRGFGGATASAVHQGRRYLRLSCGLHTLGQTSTLPWRSRSLSPRPSPCSCRPGQQVNGAASRWAVSWVALPGTLQDPSLHLRLLGPLLAKCVCGA